METRVRLDTAQKITFRGNELKLPLAQIKQSLVLGDRKKPRLERCLVLLLVARRSGNQDGESIHHQFLGIVRVLDKTIKEQNQAIPKFIEKNFKSILVVVGQKADI